MRTNGVGMQTTLYVNKTIDQTLINKINEEQNEQQLKGNTAIGNMMEKFQEMTDPLRTNLQFKFHDELNEYYVEVIDPLTNEVIKEIPPKKMLDMYAAMASFMGLLVDKRV